MHKHWNKLPSLHVLTHLYPFWRCEGKKSLIIITINIIIARKYKWNIRSMKDDELAFLLAFYNLPLLCISQGGKLNRRQLIMLPNNRAVFITLEKFLAWALRAGFLFTRSSLAENDSVVIRLQQILQKMFTTKGKLDLLSFTKRKNLEHPDRINITILWQ